jgi:hypothetical protein
MTIKCFTAPGMNVTKLFYSSLMAGHNKFKCLSLASIFMLVFNLKVVE